MQTALSCYWYAECQTLLQKHEIAADHYAFFVSYQNEGPASFEEEFLTAGRGWATLQRRAWEELESFHDQTSELVETKPHRHEDWLPEIQA